MSLAVDAPTQPHRRAARPRESWLGALAVAVSLLGFAVLVCAAAGLSLADHLPGTLDQYLPTLPGQTSLYRVQYAGGSLGFATTNVVQPSSDSISYAKVYATGQAVELHTSYTNWQGTGLDHALDDYFARDGDQLVQIAELEAGVTTLFQPSVLAWTPQFLTSSQTTPITGQTSFNGVNLDYRYWRLPDESVTLPGGGRQSARRLEFDLIRGASLISHSSSWYVAGVGLARYILTDGQGHPLQRLDLLASTQLALRGAAVTLPLPDLLLGAPPTSAYFRESAARTGAHPDVNLDPAGLRVTYRLQTGVTFIASPVFANGLFYAADQNGRLVALDAYQAMPRWRFSAGGPIVAAPAVANGIVYAAAGDKTLYALDAQHGMYLWSFHLKDNVAASAVVANGILYVGGEDRTLYALDALTGKLRWTFVAGDRVVGSAAVAGGRVFFGCDDALVYALDAATGKLMWRYAMDAPVEATPLVDQAGVVYAASNGAQMTAIDGASGRQIWNTTTRFGYLASPALGDGLIFDGDTGGTFRAYNARNGAIVWEVRGPDPQPFVSSPLVLGHQVLGADNAGTVYVWDAASGRVQQQIALGSAVTASPAWTGEAVLLADNKGELLALQSSPAQRGLWLSPVWQHQFSGGVSQNVLDNILFAQPVLSGDTLVAVVRGGVMWSIDSKTGAALRLGDLGDNVFGNLALAGNVVFAGTQHGHVAAYSLPLGHKLWSTALDGIIRFGPAAGGQQVFVNTITTTESIVSALDAATGKVQWSRHFNNGSGQPVLDRGKLYVAGDAILALDPKTGETLWRSDPFDALGSLAVYNGVVYAGSNSGPAVTFVALDAETGHSIWQGHDPVRFRSSRPAYDPATQMILAGASDGQLFAYEARTGKRRWSFWTDGALESDPQVQDGVVYVTTQSGTLYAIDVATGRLLTNFIPGTTVFTFAPPLVAAGYVYAAHGETLYALAPQTP
jgi:outer membrane protein assembly factor BamB